MVKQASLAPWGNSSANSIGKEDLTKKGTAAHLNPSHPRHPIKATQVWAALDVEVRCFETTNVAGSNRRTNVSLWPCHCQVGNLTQTAGLVVVSELFLAQPEHGSPSLWPLPSRSEFPKTPDCFDGKFQGIVVWPGARALAFKIGLFLHLVCGFGDEDHEESHQLWLIIAFKVSPPQLVRLGFMRVICDNKWRQFFRSRRPPSGTMGRSCRGGHVDGNPQFVHLLYDTDLPRCTLSLSLWMVFLNWP